MIHFRRADFAKYVALVACVSITASCIRVAVKRSEPAETVRIDGSPGVMPLVAALAKEYRAQHPHVTIEMGAGLGSQARVDSLKSGRIDIALASHGIVRDDMTRQGIAVHEVAKVAVVFAVNAGVPVASLTARQLCDIYGRGISNWSQLGGPNLAISARTRPAAEVDAEVVRAGVPCFVSAVASGAATVVERPEQMAANLAVTRGSLGMTSMPFVQQSEGRLRALALDGIPPSAETVRSGAYALTRSAFLLTRRETPPAAARFIAFARGADGAAIIAANGGVPLQ